MVVFIHQRIGAKNTENRCEPPYENKLPSVSVISVYLIPCLISLTEPEKSWKKCTISLVHWIDLCAKDIVEFN